MTTPFVTREVHRILSGPLWQPRIENRENKEKPMPDPTQKLLVAIDEIEMVLDRLKRDARTFDHSMQPAVGHIVDAVMGLREGARELTDLCKDFRKMTPAGP